MVRVPIKSKDLRIICRWRVLGALIAVLLAISLNSWRHSWKNSFLRPPCCCSQLIIEQDSCNYTGVVEDCCCDYETVDSVNEAVLHPLLQELVITPFFRYYKVKLWCDCPFWPDDGMCILIHCNVDGCQKDDLCQDGNLEAAVDHTIDARTFRDLIVVDNPCDDETDNGDMTYVNLQLNPERYTGYTGPSARRIWDAVYSEICPKYSSGDSCPENKVLYKLISGLHSSISVHISIDYLLNETTNQWGPNLQLMYDRVLKHPDRVQNLYFTLLFVHRALTKAAPYLEEAQYNSGNHLEDLKARFLIRKLLHNPKLQAACALPFDEAKLWQGQSRLELKKQIQKQLRNISALMDCVGCEKCRLWGKLQVRGLGAALKIMFSVDDQRQLYQSLQLQRYEVIALVNLLNRLSESLKSVTDMDELVLEHSENAVGLIQRLRESWMDRWQNWQFQPVHRLKNVSISLLS